MKDSTISDCAAAVVVAYLLSIVAWFFDLYAGVIVSVLVAAVGMLVLLAVLIAEAHDQGYYD